MTYRNSEGYHDPTAGLSIKRADKRPYRPLVYICSRYAGDIENNIHAARRYCRFAVKNGYIPVASHLLYPQFMDDGNPEERKLGLFFGNILMDKCDEVWIFGAELSSGMKAEYGRATRKGYKVRWFSPNCEEVVR
jgi:hypothetical protein